MRDHWWHGDRLAFWYGHDGIGNRSVYRVWAQGRRHMTFTEELERRLGQCMPRLQHLPIAASIFTRLSCHYLTEEKDLNIDQGLRGVNQ